MDEKGIILTNGDSESSRKAMEYQVVLLQKEYSYLTSQAAGFDLVCSSRLSRLKVGQNKHDVVMTKLSPL